MIKRVEQLEKSVVEMQKTILDMQAQQNKHVDITEKIIELHIAEGTLRKIKK